MGEGEGEGEVMNCLDIFAGAGGASLGLHRAGLQHLACVEWDRDACATLRAAGDAGLLDPGEVIQGDVREVDFSPWAGSCDLLWASPPCQAWSSAGKRLGAADERNGWPWTWDVVDALAPTWLIAENVPGLLHHRGDCIGPHGDPGGCPGCYWERVILPAAEARFPWVGWRVLNSSSFGVPQHRRRVYLVAGPRPIRWPEPTHGDPRDPQPDLFRRLSPWATVREALGLDGWLDVERGRGMAERHGERPLASVDGPAPMVRARSGGAAPMTLVADAPAPTRGGHAAPIVEGTRRRLDVEECARLMSWPEGYPLQGTKTSRYRQVGNGCTPPVVEALARAVVDAHGPR